MRKKVRLQPVEKRVRNFFEVALGFSKEEAEAEARRCLQCKDPLCVKGCPVEIDIPAFIKLIAQGKQKEALEKLKEKNNLPAVCGRVCPQEDQCEGVCILNKKKIPINIGALERYAASASLRLRGEAEAGSNLTCEIASSPTAPRNDRKTRGTVPKHAERVAIVGSGPAGLTCAADLAKMGYQVTVFESLHIPGGVLVYGIPEFRLPKKIVEEEIEYIKNLGVEIMTDTLIGNTYTLEELFSRKSGIPPEAGKDGFKSIFIAVGAGLPQFLGIPGENLNRVYSANEFLTRINLMKAYKFPEYATPVNIGERTVVVGGGNVALDAARSALRLGKKVTLVYRRSEKEMPARIEEIENAKEEGINFEFLTQPVKILGDEQGFVKGIECIRMKLGEPDESGRKRPYPIEGSNFILEADTVIIAVGQNPNPLLSKVTTALKTNKDGTIAVDKNFMTSIPGVFAGGDIITGADTVIAAMGAGKKAAVAIDKYLSLRGRMK